MPSSDLKKRRPQRTTRTDTRFPTRKMVRSPGSDGRPEVGAVVVSELALADLEAALRERLSAYRVPTVWVLTDDPATVPRLATGKVDKRALQRLLRSPRNL